MRTSNAKAVRILLVIVLFALACAGDMLRPAELFVAGVAGYASPRSSPAIIATPVYAAERFDLRFHATVRSDHYNDILQASGKAGPTLRLEVEPGRRLVLFVFGIDEVPVLLSEHFALNTPHAFELQSRQDGGIDVSVDGAQSGYALSTLQQLQSSAQIGARDFTFRFGEITVGGGFAPARHLRGRISAFQFRGIYVKRLPPAVELVCALLIVILLIWALWPWLRAIESANDKAASVTAALVVALFTAIGFALYLADVRYGNWAVLLCMGLGAVAAVFFVRRLRPAVPRSVVSVASLLLPFLIVASLARLPNFIFAVRMFERLPLTATFSAVAILCVAMMAFGSTARRASFSLPWRVATALPYALFAVLSLRTDSLFAPINMLHWEYFVGPMRGVHEGGWLLWDVPSQYGFLNVAIAAAVPVRPATQAFYWFQAAASFVAASILYRSLYVRLRVHWVIAAIVVCAAFFFADPLLIGPAPYPSAGAVRFLWCYVLLAVSAEYLLGPRPSIRRFTIIGGAAWILGVLWSAESAVYCTTVFFSALLTGVFLLRRCQAPGRRTDFLFLAVPLTYACVSFAIVDIVYLFGIGHLPDWSMFAAYASGYGEGFGERLLLPYGPIWLVAAVLFGAAGVFVSLPRRTESIHAACAVVAAAACAWIVASYFVGRAFPIVITTLLPLLLFSTFIIIYAGTTAGHKPLLRFIAAPVMALLFFSVALNVNAPAVLPKAVSVDTGAWQHLPAMNAELAALLAHNAVNPDTPIVYYDTWVAMPRAVSSPFDHAWLPVPLQILEAPISSEMRERIVARFIYRHALSGYFVQAMGGSNSPQSAAAWFALLRPYYRIAPVGRTTHYRLLRFTPRNQQRRVRS